MASPAEREVPEPASPSTGGAAQLPDEVPASEVAEQERDDTPLAEPGFQLADVPEELMLGPHGGSIHYYQNTAGLKLCSYWFPAVGEAKATVVAVHGNGVYLPFAFLKFQGPGQPSRYEGSWVEALNERGISVAGIDMQSCGRSEGLGGFDSHLESWHDIVADELSLVHLVRASLDDRFSTPPLFLLGASLGGCIATLCALQLQAEPWFRGCITMAPMLSLERASKAGLNPILEPIARQLAYVWPSLPVVGSNTAEMKARIPHLVAGYSQDPGVYSGATRLGCAAQFLDACAHVMAAAPEATFPLLIFHSPDDTLTDPLGSREFLEASSSEDKRYVSAVGMWHDLIQEPGNEALLPQVIEWLEERIDRPPAPGAKCVDAATVDASGVDPTKVAPLPAGTAPADAIVSGSDSAVKSDSAGGGDSACGSVEGVDASEFTNAATPTVVYDKIDIHSIVETAKVEGGVPSVAVAMAYLGKQAGVE